METGQRVEFNMVYMTMIICTLFQAEVARSLFHLENAADIFRLENAHKIL